MTRRAAAIALTIATVALSVAGYALVYLFAVREPHAESIETDTPPFIVECFDRMSAWDRAMYAVFLPAMLIDQRIGGRGHQLN